MAEDGIVAEEFVNKQPGDDNLRAALSGAHAFGKTVHTEIVAMGVDIGKFGYLDFGDFHVAYCAAVNSHSFVVSFLVSIFTFTFSMR